MINFDKVVGKYNTKLEKPKKRQLSVYIDEENAKELDLFLQQRGKGAKSELINDLIQAFFASNPNNKEK